MTAPAVARAAILPDCNPVPGGANPCGIADMFQLLVNIYNFLLGMAAIVLMLMLVWSGIQMLIAQYNEQPTSAMENAKLSLRRAVFGFVIIAVAYILVYTLLTVLGVADPSSFFTGVKFKPD